MLSYDDKVIKNIIHSFMNFEKSIKIPASSETDVCSLIAYLRYESTILFHLGEVKYVFYPRFKEAVLTPCYLYSKKDYETIVSQLVATVQKIRDQICTSPTNIEREMRIHDALCTNVTYADDGSESHSIVGPLLYHRGVCDGISKTAKVLLQECGIKTHVVYGTAVTTDGKSEPHAWNVVYLNGNWYHLDVTFDNTLSKCRIRYDYCNVTTDEIAVDHTMDPSSVGFTINCSDDNDFYLHNNRYFDSMIKLKEYLYQCVSQSECYIQIRVAKSLTEKDVIRTFQHAISLLKHRVCYEQSINPARNIYVWSLWYK